MFGPNYYQQRAQLGTWGTPEYQFGRPPPITFQPQPNWSGLDYFNAHAFNPDPNIYNQAMGNMYNFPGATRDNAKRWHRRVYGGDGNYFGFTPDNLGAAAAYEAYRSWKYNTHLSEPLSGERERQREALVGLAIAEATRLINTSNYAGDQYKRSQVCNSAAATASELFIHYDSRTGNYRGRPLSRPPSPYMGSDAGSDILRGRARSRSVGGHYTRSRSRGAYAGVGAYPNAGYPMPGSTYGGIAGSAYGGGAGSVYDSSPYSGGSDYGAYPPAPSPYGPTFTPGSYPNSQGYPSSMPMQGGVPHATSNTMPIVPPHRSRSRSHSFSDPYMGGGYPSQQYMSGQSVMGGSGGYYPAHPSQVSYQPSNYGQPMVQYPGQTIIIPGHSSSHRSSHRKHGHHRGRTRTRSRSRDRSRSRHGHGRSRSREQRYISY